MTGISDGTGWTGVVDAFPRAARPLIRDIHDSGGVLHTAKVEMLLKTVNLDIESLMIGLLPVAARFAMPAISNFNVGAVAQGAGGLYFGANVEFRGQSPGCAVHAEQAAVNNAWLNGETGLRRLAISAAPCGHCRQFLYELGSGPDLILLMHGGRAGNVHRSRLGAMLPHAFGPSDLGEQGRLMATNPVRLALADDTQDPLTRAALHAAESSYVPYTSGFAGCAVEIGGADIYTGRFAENAAYNPSLSPLGSGIAFMTLNRGLRDTRVITRAVLVEVPSRGSQRDATRAVLSSTAPTVTLEYAPARLVLP